MLTKEQKDQLNEYFRGKDLYDPSKDKNQNPMSQGAEALCGGGMAGYASGGQVSNYDISRNSMTSTGNMLPPGTSELDSFALPEVNSNPANSAWQVPNPKLGMPKSSNMPNSESTAMPEAMPVKSGSSGNNKMLDEMRTFFEGLKQNESSSPENQRNAAMDVANRNRLVGMTAAPVAAFADAIMQGVARAGNPGFQKAIQDQSNARLSNEVALNAAMAEQERANRGEKLGLEQANPLSGLNQAQVKALAPSLLKLGVPPESIQYMTPEVARALFAGQISLKEAEARIEETKNQQRMMALNFAGNLSKESLGSSLSKMAGFGGDAQKDIARNELLNMAGVGPGGTAKESIPVIKSESEYKKLPKGARYQDSAGKMGIKK